MQRSIFISLSALLFALTFTSCGPQIEETQPVRKNVTETVFASGSLEAKGMYQLTARTSGYLTQLPFEEGQVVKVGQVLAVIENAENIINTQGANQLLEIAKSNTESSAPQLRQAEHDIEIRKGQMEQDKLTAERYKRLWESNSIARIDYEKAQLTYETSQRNYESALENYRRISRDANQQVVSSQTNVDIYSTAMGKNQVKAVIEGKVYRKFKEVGDYVKQGEVIAEIGSPSVMYAQVNVDESSISRIELGQEAVVQLNIDRDRTFRGVVREIDPAFDEATQSFLCNIYFLDPMDFGIVNTQLQANIIVGEQEDALLIPRNYLEHGGFVQVKGQEEKTPVTTQFVSNEWVQVTSGIDEQTTLVTQNLSIQ